MTSQHNHASAPPRRSFMNIFMMLVMFYLAVFAALHILQFEFPFTILYTIFFLIAIPFGLVVVGSIHFIYLLRLRLGSQTATMPAPAKLASLFVGSTIVICAYFISVYPEWRMVAADSWATTIEEKIPATVPRQEREALVQDVHALWLRYWQLIEIEGTDVAENHPELTEAFQFMVSTATSDPMSDRDYEKLRALVPVSRGLPQPDPEPLKR